MGGEGSKGLGENRGVCVREGMWGEGLGVWGSRGMEGGRVWGSWELGWESVGSEREGGLGE